MSKEYINQKLAVLIDADNAQPSRIESILDEIAKYGTASVKRIYADWTKPNANGWKKILLEHSIQPIQQFGYTTGKNSTDSALIIDAIDLLYTKNFNGFCIISSDSDFTRLATRIREEGLTVYGFGEKKTPIPFIKACDKFIYVEILDQENNISEESIGLEQSSIQANNPESKIQKTQPISTLTSKDKTKLISQIKKAYNSIIGEEKNISLGHLASAIIKMQPDFDSRNYGHSKFSSLIKSLDKAFTIVNINNRPAKVMLKEQS